MAKIIKENLAIERFELSRAEALKLMERYKISGVPITHEGKLVGILTNRDLRFENNFSQPISNIMTKDNLVTAPVGTSLEEAQKILGKHRIEKLPIVDNDYKLKGLITIKDIEKAIQYPNSAKDKNGVPLPIRIFAAIVAIQIIKLDIKKPAGAVSKVAPAATPVTIYHTHIPRIVIQTQNTRPMSNFFVQTYTL